MMVASLLLYAASVALSLSSIATNAQDGSSHVPAGDVVPSNHTNEATLTNPNSTVPKGTKTYTVGLQTSAYDDEYSSDSFAAAILISPTHVLTGRSTITSDIRYASIGSHYNNGTADGEQIKVVAIMYHPNISENAEYAYDFVILQLEKPSSFEPIPMTDGSDIKDGETVTKLGWYSTGGQGQNAVELQRVDVQLISNEECSKLTSVDESRMCSRPVDNQESCTGDYGGPVIVERPEGDVLVGMVSWGDNCRKPGYPSYYSRIPVGREWIDSVIGGSCYH
ncbi:Serine protease trypsin-like protein [Phytophthora megakarya]|uniref:Serine protease trypsin-like protein n=1 Tax=Phytophthora megakarya TaxID=4795 RepID=A0A225UU79_9STRA|nr:Serine protease trypsin-like protein [Phytophthora megakarya]